MRPESESPDCPKPAIRLQLAQKNDRSNRRVSAGEAELSNHVSRLLVEEDKKPNILVPEKKEEPVTVAPDWEMFEKVCVLGEGAYGTVYNVKCLRTSIIGGDGARVALN